MYHGIVCNPGQVGVRFSAPDYRTLREKVHALTHMSDEAARLVIWDEFGSEIFVGTVKKWRDRQ